MGGVRAHRSRASQTVHFCGGRALLLLCILTDASIRYNTRARRRAGGQEQRVPGNNISAHRFERSLLVEVVPQEEDHEHDEEDERDGRVLLDERLPARRAAHRSRGFSRGGAGEGAMCTFPARRGRTCSGPSERGEAGALARSVVGVGHDNPEQLLLCSVGRGCTQSYRSTGACDSHAPAAAHTRRDGRPHVTHARTDTGTNDAQSGGPGPPRTCPCPCARPDVPHHHHIY